MAALELEKEQEEEKKEEKKEKEKEKSPLQIEQKAEIDAIMKSLLEQADKYEALKERNKNVEEEEEIPDPAMKMKSISSDGFITIEFNQDMIVP